MSVPNVSQPNISDTLGTEPPTSDHIGEPLHPAAKIVFLLVGIAVFLSGVLGNGLLLLVLATQRLLWQVHNIFIANLAVADLLVVASGLPHLILELVLGYHPLVNDWHCRAYGFTITVSFMVSLTSLVGISFNRYMKIGYSRLFLKLFSVKKNISICVFLWVLAVALNLPSLVGWLPPFQFDAKAHVCGSRGEGEGDIVMSIIMVASVIAVSFFNFAIFRRWREIRNKLSETTNHSTARERGDTSRDTPDSGRDLAWTVLDNQDSRRTEEDTGAVIESNISGDEESVQNRPNPQACLSAGKTANTLCTASATSFSTGKTKEAATSRRDIPKTKTKTTAGVALRRSLLVISVVLVVLFVQFAVVAVINSVVQVPTELMLASSLLLTVNCAVNWIIYGVMNTSFRHAYVCTLRCSTCCKR